MNKLVIIESAVVLILARPFVSYLSIHRLSYLKKTRPIVFVVSNNNCTLRFFHNV